MHFYGSCFQNQFDILCHSGQYSAKKFFYRIRDVVTRIFSSYIAALYTVCMYGIVSAKVYGYYIFDEGHVSLNGTLHSGDKNPKKV